MRRNKLPIIVASICMILVLSVIPLTSACAKPTPAPAPAPAPTPAPTPTPAPAPKEPIKIGALLPLTGPFAMWGPWFERAHRYALDEVNWEVAGRPIQLIIEDEGGTDSTVAMEKARKLVEQDKIDVLFGPFWGPSRLPVFPYLEQLKKVSIGFTCATQEEIKYDYHFEGQQGMVDINYPLGRYAAEDLGLKTIATIAWDIESVHDFVGGFVKGFEEGGGTVVQQQWTEVGAADYTPYLLALKPSDGVAVMCAGAEGQMKILSQAYELGIPQKVKWFVCGTAELESPEVRAELGDKGVGAYYSGPWLASIDTPENKQFIADYKAKVGVAPTAWDHLKYEETRVLLAALKATGGDPDGDKLKKALLELKIDLPSGPFLFDEGRIGVRNFYVGQVQKVGGEYVGAVVKAYPTQHTTLKIYPYP